MKLLIFLLSLPLSLFGQKYYSEKNDSIHIDTTTFLTYFIKLSDNSTTDAAMIFVVPNKSFDSLKKQIPLLYFSKKQEYDEFYVLSVADISKRGIIKRAITEFINQIDSSRFERNRSTFMRLYSLDKNNRIVYQTTSKDLQQVDNLYYLNSAKELCKYLVCPEQLPYLNRQH